MQNHIIILAGPTASGKTAMSIDIAHNINATIINADSQQVYKEIPIITAQPGIEEQRGIEHLLFGEIRASENFSVSMWLEKAVPYINSTIAAGKTPLLVGGTGLYIKALTTGIAQIPEIDDNIRQEIRDLCSKKGLNYIYELLLAKDHDTAATLKPNDRQRILRAYEVLIATGHSISYWQQQKPKTFFNKDMFKIFCLLPERKEVYARSDSRFLQMIKNGAIDEVKTLIDMQIKPSLPAMKAHGVPELISYLNGEKPLEKAIEKTQQYTRNYIKRQFTWFRHQMPGAVVIDNNQNLREILKLL